MSVEILVAPDRGFVPFGCPTIKQTRNMKNLAKSSLFISLLIIAMSTQAQEITKNLDSFDKIIVSPKINLILKKGDQESILIKYSNVASDKINIKLTGSTLRIYLTDARIVEKQKKAREENYSSSVSIYRDAVVTAYVTYVELKVLDIRGEEEVTCDGAIDSDKFKLKAYGEAEIALASIHTKKFKAVLYGENKLTIKDGQTGHQRYRLYGENKIDTRAFSSETISSTMYGEGRISVNASDEVRINAFGEPRINVSGTSHISRGIIIGKADIRMN